MKRYSPETKGFNEDKFNMIQCWDGEYCKYSDVKQLQARIKELESDKHINEIKASAICEALNEDMEFMASNPQPRNFEYGMTLIRLNSAAEKLRTKHD